MERDIKKLNKINYRPFEGINNFWLYTDNGGNKRYLEHSSVNSQYIVEIKPEGYTPKTGLLVAACLHSQQVQGRSVLDLCTGETGIIAIHAASQGASRVLGVDIDKETVNWAKHNVSINNLSNVEFDVSNLFGNITGKYDIITANPPQMPMMDGHPHDSGGLSGRDVVDKIITESKNYLNPNGEVYMMLFDFLGVDRGYNDFPTVKELFNNCGFDMEIVSKIQRNVRKGGETEKSFNHISTVYPQYSFKSENGNNFHEAFVIRAKLR